MKKPLFSSGFGDKESFGYQSTGRVHYNGFVNLGDLFRMMRGWLMTKEYLFVEKTAKHKHGSGGGDKEYEWRATRDTYDYLRYEIRMIIKAKDIIDVEIARKGKTEKLQQCKLQIHFEGILKYDPDNKRFGKSTLGKNLKEIYHKYVVNKDITNVWQDRLDSEIKTFKNAIHSFLELEATQKTVVA